MERSWTIGKKLSLGFLIPILALCVVGGLSYYSVDRLISTNKSATATHEVLTQLAELISLMKDTETGQRGYLLTGRDSYLQPYLEALPRIPVVFESLGKKIEDTPEQRRRLEDAHRLINAKLAELKSTIDAKQSAGGIEAALKIVLNDSGKRIMDDLRAVVTEMDHEEKRVLEERTSQAEASGSASLKATIIGVPIALILVIIIAIFITRSLTHQIGSAVQHMQSSSAELQSAATQQSSGAQENTAAMNEVSTTMNELLGTSRQIAESAQRVAQIAVQAGTEVRGGDQTVQRGQESIASIKHQVDLIVTHMLELGRKSQQIGGILEIVNELAEQTNILSINATIEAAGAGEAGKRFAVVADEIRKLAERAGSSNKEIRNLIEEVRAAVNTSVMITEGGSKAVDAGARQFTDVAVAFGRISSLVSTTIEAAREIELSTKQQSSAVEQTTGAVAGVLQATAEVQASAGQILQTATQLATLSRALSAIVQADIGV